MTEKYDVTYFPGRLGHRLGRRRKVH